MFEKYSEDARVSFFHARYTVEGGTAIEPENLLLGILRAAPGVVRSIGGVDAEAVKAIVLQLKQLLTRGELVQPRELLPFSARLKLVLEQAGKEAQSSGADLGPAHMLLACVLSEARTPAANVMIDAGLTVSRLRDYVENQKRVESQCANAEGSLPARSRLT